MSSVFPPDSPFLGAFGSLIANPETPVVTLDFPYNINPAYVTTAGTVNGGSVTQANSQAVFQTGTNAAGAAVLESLISARYSPGQGQMGRFTFGFAAPRANSRQLVGIGTSTDGYFFGFVNTTFGMVRRQNGTDFFTAQSAFNGPDQFLGFDPSFGNVYEIEYQWLGYGAIRGWIENPATGLPGLVNTINYTNSNVLPSVFNPNLPIRIELVNAGNTTSLSAFCASAGIYCQGPFNSSGARFSVGNRKTAIGAETSIFALQNKATFQGKTNRGRIHIDSIGSAISGGSDSQYRMVLNPTLGGAPSFTDINTTQSIAAFDVAGTTVTGGTEIRRGPTVGNFQLQEEVSQLQIRLNPSDLLVMAAGSFAGNVAPNLSLSWTEEL